MLQLLIHSSVGRTCGAPGSSLGITQHVSWAQSTLSGPRVVRSCEATWVSSARYHTFTMYLTLNEFLNTCSERLYCGPVFCTPTLASVTPYRVATHSLRRSTLSTLRILCSFHPWDLVHQRQVPTPELYSDHLLKASSPFMSLYDTRVKAVSKDLDFFLFLHLAMVWATPSGKTPPCTQGKVTRSKDQS